MGLRIGIVGLPNAGKSTVFNALTRSQNARVANFPFSTVEPNRAVVPVSDPRLDAMHQILGVPEKIYATIEFVDIAGLVRGASRGEGLGNQFLGQIRNMDAILHVVRCFDDPNVASVTEGAGPEHDIEVVETELILADIEQLDRAMERLHRQVKGDKKLLAALKEAQGMRDHLDGGQPLRSYEAQSPEYFQSLEREMRFLTAKKTIFAANVDENALGSDGECALSVRAAAARQQGEFIKIGAKFEEELVGMNAEEQQEFLELAGINQSGLDRFIRISYQTLGLISFFTTNENEVRAWTIPEGWGAAQAAGVIHTDFEKGFIRAEVISYDRFATFRSFSEARQAGAIQLEGREYLVRDGDILYFRFNV